MGHRSVQGHSNKIALLAALTYLGFEPSICWGQPLADNVSRILGPGTYVLEGAVLVLLFFSLAVALPICSFITGIRSPLYNRLSLTALSAAVYALTVSGLGTALLSSDVHWQYISMFFLWLIPAGVCACLKEFFPAGVSACFFQYAEGGCKLFAAASLIGVAANIAGFSFFIKLFAAVLAVAFIATTLVLIRALRTGKRHAEILLLGILAIPGFGLVSILMQSFGFNLPLSCPALWGLLAMLGSFVSVLKLPKPPMDHLSSVITEAKLSSLESVPTEVGGKPVEWQNKISSFAHEINTPLSTGLLTATHLQDEVGELYELFQNNSLKKSDLEKGLLSYKEASGMIITNLETAAGLVRSFRNEAAEAPKMNRQRFNINNHLVKILTALTPRIKEAGHQLHYACPESLLVNSDPVIFSQIISNLIINSLTHAYAPGASGNLTIEVLASQDNMKVTYRDDGKGIDKKLLNKIFEPYFTTNAGAGNTGLGLYIVHSLVTQHLGGSIECSSMIGHGTTFTLQIPIEGS